MAKIRIFFLHGFLGLPEDGDSIQKILKSEFKANARDQFEWHPIDFLNTESLNSKQELKDWGKNFCDAVLSLPQEACQNVLLGYSMGGRLAQMAFVHNPELFSKMICISSHVGLSSEQERKERYKSDQVWAFKFMREKFDATLKDWNAQAVFNQSKSEPKRSEKKYSKTALMDCLLRWSLSKQEFSPQVFLKNKSKIHWIVGAEDSKYTSLGRLLEEKHYVQECLVVEKSGHRVLFDNSKGLAQALLRILSNSHS